MKMFAIKLMENLRLQGDEEFNRNYVERIVADTQDQCSDPFHLFDSAYLQNKYFEKVLRVIEPREIVLGEKAVRQRSYVSGNKCVIVSKNNCTYYVPIIDNIRNWLSNGRIRNMILSAPKCNNNGFLIDFCCGDIFRQHTLLQNGNTIPIILYYDDIDVCNPIGTRASIHKLGMFYFFFREY